MYNQEEYQGDTDNPQNLIEKYRKTLPNNHDRIASEGAV